MKEERLHSAGGSETFDWGGGGVEDGSKLWFRKDCWTFLWQITSPHTPHTLSNQSRFHVIIPWPLDTVILLVNDSSLEHPPVVLGNKDCTCRFRWISLEFSLVAKCNSRFIEKISQLKSDIRSCRCKNFSLKQVSGLKGGRGGSPSVFTFISIISWGYIRCFKFLFFTSPARAERIERVKPSLVLAWDMWISPKIFLDQLNESWFPERSANFYSALSRESDRTLCSVGVSTSQYSSENMVCFWCSRAWIWRFKQSIKICGCTSLIIRLPFN